eukprot:3221321-Prymnesium_polylepis.2
MAARVARLRGARSVHCSEAIDDDELAAAQSGAAGGGGGGSGGGGEDGGASAESSERLAKSRGQRMGGAGRRTPYALACLRGSLSLNLFASPSRALARPSVSAVPCFPRPIAQTDLPPVVSAGSR